MKPANKQIKWLWIGKISRLISGVLAVIWMVFGGFIALLDNHGHRPVGWWEITFILPGAIMLLATIVAGRWQLIGGSILILESLGYLTYFLSYLTEENAILMNIMIPSLWMLPVLIAGISMAICSQKLKEDKVIVEGVYR